MIRAQLRLRRPTAPLARHWLLGVGIALVLPVAALSAPSAAATQPPASTVTVIVGSAGDDVLIGTPGPDLIMGLGGQDYIDGGGGVDVILGGPGDDTIIGGPGNDFVDGGAGDDTTWRLSWLSNGADSETEVEARYEY